MAPAVAPHPNLKQDSTTLFVHNLHPHTTAQHLEALFSSVGPLRRCFVITANKDKETDTDNQEKIHLAGDTKPPTSTHINTHSNTLDRLKCKGYGFVQYALNQDAQTALAQLQSHVILGKNIAITTALRRERAGGRNVIKERKEKTTTSQDKQELDGDQDSDLEETIRLHEAQKLHYNHIQHTTEKENHIISQKKLALTDSSAPATSDLVKHTIHPEGSLQKKTLVVTLDLDPNHPDASTPAPISDDQYLEQIKALTRSLALQGLQHLYKSPAPIPTVQIVFDSFLHATEAAAKLHATSIPTQTNSSVKLNAYIEAAPVTKRARIIVRNLPFTCGENQLKDIFTKFGAVKLAHIPQVQTVKKQKDKNKPQKTYTRNAGFGFIEYFLPGDANTAITAMNGKKISGRVVAVDHAVAKDLYQENKDRNQQDEKIQHQDVDHDIDHHDQENDHDHKHIQSKNSDSDSHADANADVESHSESDIPPRQKKEPVSTDEQLERTIFVRNLPFETSAQQLRAVMQAHGHVEQCVLVLNHDTGRAKGSAFVRFKEKQHADALLKLAGYDPMVDQANPLNHHPHLLDDINSAEGIHVDGRRIVCTPALKRKQAQNMKMNQLRKGKQDKRNMWLAWEGHIKPDSPAAQGLSEDDLTKRANAEQSKRMRLMKNPNTFVSTTRLSVRNLPRDVDENLLRKIFVNAATVMKETPDKSLKRKYVFVKQTKIVRDDGRKDSEGTLRSKGYGFIEFREHEDALRALRKVNNNPSTFKEFLDPQDVAGFKDTYKNRRLIVEFALEDKRKLAILERTKKIGKIHDKSKAKDHKNSNSKKKDSNKDKKPIEALQKKGRKRKSNDQDETPAAGSDKSKKAKRQKPTANENQNNDENKCSNKKAERKEKERNLKKGGAKNDIEKKNTKRPSKKKNQKEKGTPQNQRGGMMGTVDAPKSVVPLKMSREAYSEAKASPPDLKPEKSIEKKRKKSKVVNLDHDEKKLEALVARYTQKIFQSKEGRQVTKRWFDE